MNIIDGRKAFRSKGMVSPLKSVWMLGKRIRRCWERIRTDMRFRLEDWMDNARRRAILRGHSTLLRILMAVPVPVPCRIDPVFVSGRNHNLLNRSNLGDGLIVWAVYAGRVESIKTLLQYPSQQIHLTLAVNSAVVTGQADIVSLLLEAMNRCGEQCQSWVGQRAGKHGNLDVLKVFVERGYPLDGKHFGAQSPLYFALDRKDTELTRFLVETGCTIQTDEESNALMWWAVDEFPELGRQYDSETSEAVLHSIPGHRFVNGQPWAEFDAGWVNLNVLLWRILGKEEMVSTDANSMETLLMKEVREQDLECVRQLLEEDLALLKSENMPVSGNTVVPFHWLKYGNSAIDRQDRDGMTALHIAVTSGNRHIAKVLLESAANALIANHHGDYPLHTACSNGDCEMATLLLHFGAETDILDNQGRTPLFQAVRRNRGDCVKLLLDAGADPSIQDRKQLTCLHMYRGRKPEPWLERVVDECADRSHDAYISALNFCLMNDFLDLAERIYRQNEDNGQRDAEGETALHRAVLTGDPGWVKRLLDDGVDPNIQNGVGMTPLCYCLVNDDIVLFQLLINAGADTKLPMGSGRTLLHHAAHWEEAERVVNEALRLGADPNLVDDWDSPPLLEAIKMNNLRLAEKLIRAGADVTKRDIFGESPFNHASKPGVRKLLEPMVSICEAGEPFIVRVGFSNGQVLRFGMPEHFRVNMDPGDETDMTLILSKLEQLLADLNRPNQ